ncbi:MAG: hypothetical protein NC906_03700 [Candidatus Omnitrophica bacterium]|nr:hypothetical protein [Candidatus Omnitrophota bacterium]
MYKNNANVPNWDLISTCNINNKKGLILIEGKAHELELEKKGKIFIPGKSSISNHEKISKCINEARQFLIKQGYNVNISIDSHYQVSNRIAWAWKLANLGVPVIMVFLGFIGDKYFPDYFQDEKHWLSVFNSYIEGILPASFFEKSIDCGNSEMRVIVRSKSIENLSSKQ